MDSLLHPLRDWSSSSASIYARESAGRVKKLGLLRKTTFSLRNQALLDFIKI